MIGRWTTEEGKEKESYNKRIGEGKKTNNIRDKPDDNNEGKTNGEGANIGSKRNSGTTLRKWGGGACNADSGGSRNTYNRAGSEASKV